MQIYIIVWGQHEALQQVKMNVVLKPRLIFNCLIITRNYKSREMKIEQFLLYRNYALFPQATKSFGKNLKQNISLFLF